MPFKRYMEVGRVVLMNHGVDSGNLATVIEIVDQNKCMVDGPCGRKVVSYTQLTLTDLTVQIPRNAKASTLAKAWEEAGTQEKWDNSSWAKKLVARKKRVNLSDFDRFKVMVARKQKAKIIADKMASM